MTIRDFFAAAIGRPRAVEGEKMVVSDGMLASQIRPGQGGVYFMPMDEILRRHGWRTYREMRFDDQVKSVLAFKRILIAGRTWDLKPAVKIKPPPKPIPLPAPPPVAGPPGAAAPGAPKAPPGALKAAEAPPPAAEDPKAPGAKKPKQTIPEGMQPGKMPDGSDYVEPTPEEQAKADKAQEVASFVDWALRRIDTAKLFDEALSSLEFGFALGEKVFERVQYNGKQVVTLKALKFRDPETIELKMDDHGNWEGARQIQRGVEVRLDPDKLFLYTHNGRFGNIYGESDLRSAYRSWWAKKFIINFWNVYLERMGAPMTKMSYPQGASEELKETLKRILKNLASKTEILVPQGVEIDLIEATRSGSPDYEKALSFHNNSIARAMLMVSLLGTGGEDNIQQGSQSQSSLHLRILFKMADGIAQNLQREFMQQVVKQLVEFNFDGDPEELMPTFVWQDYGQFEGMKVADTIRLLFAAGILDLDQTDVNYARSILGLPIRGEDDPEDQINRPPPPPPPGNPNAPPPKAGTGNERAKKGGDPEHEQTEAADSLEGNTRFALVLEEVRSI
jgi:phage gp29-like protein